MNQKLSLQNIAQETIEISKKGSFPLGNRLITFPTENNTILYKENSFGNLIKDVETNCKVYESTKFEVRNEGTVDAIFRRTKNRENTLDLGILNFASAHSPGGGFEAGAMAQEECLAYCSDLYLKQITGSGKEFYEINRKLNKSTYTDNMFISNVTFFRNGRFNLMPNPVTCSVLTSPAVNMNRIRREEEDYAKMVMKNRMKKILYVFAKNSCKDIILGAFGCGVFGNYADDVAYTWRALLVDEGMQRFFNSITFSVLAFREKDFNLEAFQDILGNL